MGGERYAAAVLRAWREVSGVASMSPELSPAAGAPALSTAGTALALELQGATAELSLAIDGAARLRAAGSGVLPPPTEAAVERGAWQPVTATPREVAGGAIELGNPRAPLHLTVDREALSVRLVDRHDATHVALHGLAFATSGGVRVELAVSPGARILGFGDAPGGLDKRGLAFVLRNREPSIADGRGTCSVSVPAFVVQREGGGACFGVLVDGFSATRFDVCTAGDHIRIECPSGGLDLMLFPGPRPLDVAEQLSRRLGRTPLPPLWALGHHAVRRTRTGLVELRALGVALRRSGVATTALHVDTRRAGISGDPERRLLADLGNLGLHVVAIADPCVRSDPRSQAYREGCAREIFYRRADGDPAAFATLRGRIALPDFNRDDTQAWWTERLSSALRNGVAGIADAALPRRSPVAALARALGIAGQACLQSDPRDPKGSVPHEQVHNLHALQRARATRRSLEAASCERRAFVATRSGAAGIQRYAAVAPPPRARGWTLLRDAIPMLLSLSLSGVPYCGVIGRLGGRRSALELYARTIQLHALMPYACTEGALARRRTSRRARQLAHAALALRGRLLPYLYALFREAEASGTPIWRALGCEFPNDAEAAQIEDAFMLGDALLVAPVLESGARERDVYLPAGAWTCWHEGARYTGPRWIRARAPLERTPLFARAGSVLPLCAPARRGPASSASADVLAVFPGADAGRVWVEDDGESVAYRGDVVARTTLRLFSRAGGRLRLEIGRREGPFAVPERPLRVQVHGCPPPQAVFLDGARLPARAQAPGFTSIDGNVNVHLIDRGAGASLEVDPAP
jgi:alpha-glucosidase